MPLGAAAAGFIPITPQGSSQLGIYMGNIPSGSGVITTGSTALATLGALFITAIVRISCGPTTDASLGLGKNAISTVWDFYFSIPPNFTPLIGTTFDFTAQLQLGTAGAAGTLAYSHTGSTGLNTAVVYAVAYSSTAY